MKRFLLLLVSLPMSLPALAHPGHGNTPLHAFMHMVEDHGLLIGVVFVVAIGTLIYRATHASNRQNKRQHKETRRDPR